MADVFYHSDAVALLKKKHIILIGDSNMRAIYKDLVMLLNENSLLKKLDLKMRQEESFCGDKLGKHSELHRGRDYEEERSFKKGDIRVDFIFITRCYNTVLVDMLEDIHLGLKVAPDVIYINSTLWDVNRWGPKGVLEFKDNLQKLARLFKSSLPLSTLLIWATALPVSFKVESSLLIKQLKFLGQSLRFDVMEANDFARQVMVSHGFDVIDNHFHMRMQMHRRVRDGVHYFPIAMRLLTNLLLTHIALSWDVPLPNRVNTILLEKAKGSFIQVTSSASSQFKFPEILSAKPKIPNKSKSPPRQKNGEWIDYKRPKRNFAGLSGPVQWSETFNRSGRVKSVSGKNSRDSALSWDVPLPNRDCQSLLIEKAKDIVMQVASSSSLKMNFSETFSSNSLNNLTGEDAKKKKTKKRKKSNTLTPPSLAVNWPSQPNYDTPSDTRVWDSASSQNVPLHNWNRTTLLDKAKEIVMEVASSSSPKLNFSESFSSNFLSNPTGEDTNKQKSRKRKKSNTLTLPSVAFNMPSQPNYVSDTHVWNSASSQNVPLHNWNRTTLLDKAKEIIMQVASSSPPTVNFPESFLSNSLNNPTGGDTKKNRSKKQKNSNTLTLPSVAFNRPSQLNYVSDTRVWNSGLDSQWDWQPPSEYHQWWEEPQTNWAENYWSDSQQPWFQQNEQRFYNR